jgi:hypothetical protein
VVWFVFTLGSDGCTQQDRCHKGLQERRLEVHTKEWLGVPEMCEGEAMNSERKRRLRGRVRAFYEHMASRLTEADHERDFPEEPQCAYDSVFTRRKGVCRRCHVVMQDIEDMSPHGEFIHPMNDKDGKPHWCPNAGITFTTRNTELVPFMPKSTRRRYKRLGIRP